MRSFFLFRLVLFLSWWFVVFGCSGLVFFKRKYMICAEDTMRDTGDTPDNVTKLAIAGLKDDVTKKLKMRVELSLEMKAMVVLNIATDADIANGTCGTVEGFVLDPREKSTTPDEEDGCIHLQYLPPVIYFKPYSHKTMSFEGVPVGIIPISPSTVQFSVERDGEKVKLERRHCSWCSFLDMHSQITKHRAKRWNV